MKYLQPCRVAVDFSSLQGARRAHTVRRSVTGSSNAGEAKKSLRHARRSHLAIQPKAFSRGALAASHQQAPKMSQVTRERLFGFRHAFDDPRDRCSHADCSRSVPVSTGADSCRNARS